MSNYVPPSNAQAQSWLRRNRSNKSGMRKSNTTPAYSGYQQSQKWLDDQRKQRENWSSVVENDGSLVYRRQQGKTYGKAAGGGPEPVPYVPNAQAQAWLSGQAAQKNQAWMRSRGANRNADTLKSMPKPDVKSMPKPLDVNIGNYPWLDPQVQGPPPPAGYDFNAAVAGLGSGYGRQLRHTSTYPRGGGGGGGGSGRGYVTQMQGQNQGGYVGRAGEPQQYGGGRYGSPQYRRDWLQTLTRLRIG